MRPGAAVIVVSDLARSSGFYCRLLDLAVEREHDDAVLLAGRDGSHLVLRQLENATRATGVLGVQYLIWNADDDEDFGRAERALQSMDAHVSTWTGQGITTAEDATRTGFRLADLLVARGADDTACPPCGPSPTDGERGARQARVIGRLHGGSGAAHRYRLISADSHVNEPPDLWTARVPAALRDRAPRIERFERGRRLGDRGRRTTPINFGMNACAGLEPEEMQGWVRFEDIRRGRLRPGGPPRGDGSRRRRRRGALPDPAAVERDRRQPRRRASTSPWSGPTTTGCPSTSRTRPDRFGGLAMLPNRGGPRRPSPSSTGCWTGRACAACVIGCYPNGTLGDQPDDDQVWGALAERGMPLSIHVVADADRCRRRTAPSCPATGASSTRPNRMIEMVFAGVFDRFPDLDVVFAEVDFGWVPYVKEQIDNNYHRLDPVSRFGLQQPAQRVHRRSTSTSRYITDTFGIRNRDDVGVERILWSSDYPHISADWPYSSAHDPVADSPRWSCPPSAT